MKTYLIYKHTTKINGKCYIGQTCYKNPEHRWHSDGSGYKTQQKFYRAIKKYTWDNFEHEILARNLSKQEADILEIKFIEQFNSINRDSDVSRVFPGGTRPEDEYNRRYYTTLNMK